MGVLNVTPDSFSDGGLWFDHAAATAHGLALAAEGAHIVDVGGESTRPGASPVPADEEIRRIVPVVAALSKKLDVPISVDTRRASVARAALEAGASVINDTAGEASEPEMDALIAECDAGVIVMHSRGSPETMMDLTDYSDVVKEVGAFLLERADALEAVGVRQDSIALDPGFGFAKTGEQNLALLGRLDELTGFGFPVVAGTSRKSFIGRLLSLPTSERLEGSIATAIWAMIKGARIIRVHDVDATLRAVKMIEAIQNALPQQGLI
jgi:dihydropteroate synthase